MTKTKEDVVFQIKTELVELCKTITAYNRYDNIDDLACDNFLLYVKKCLDLIDENFEEKIGGGNNAGLCKSNL